MPGFGRFRHRKWKITEHWRVIGGGVGSAWTAWFPRSCLPVTKARLRAFPYPSDGAGVVLRPGRTRRPAGPAPVHTEPAGLARAVGRAGRTVLHHRRVGPGPHGQDRRLCGGAGLQEPRRREHRPRAPSQLRGAAQGLFRGAHPRGRGDSVHSGGFGLLRRARQGGPLGPDRRRPLGPHYCPRWHLPPFHDGREQ